jgi:hypothetical protein
LAICWNIRGSGGTERELGDKPTGADNQQGRPEAIREPSETARQTEPKARMIQSDLHGDMQSPAEMAEPDASNNGSTE